MRQRCIFLYRSSRESLRNTLALIQASIVGFVSSVQGPSHLEQDFRVRCTLFIKWNSMENTTDYSVFTSIPSTIHDGNPLANSLRNALTHSFSGTTEAQGAECFGPASWLLSPQFSIASPGPIQWVEGSVARAKHLGFRVLG